MVWCYRRNRRPTLRGVKSVASEEDYYSLKDADDAFKQIETDSSPIIKRLITTTKMDLTEDECITISWFFASLLCRTPWYEKNQIRGHLEGLRHILKFVSSDEEMFKQAAANAGLDISKAEELEGARQLLMEPESVQMDPKKNKDYFLRQGLKLTEETALLLYDKYWHIVESSTEGVFVTSDNPVTLLPPKDHHPSDGLGLIEASIMLPISPSRCLVLRNREATEKIIPFPSDKVEYYNYYVMWSSDEMIFSSNLSQDIQNLLESTKKERDEKESSVLR